MKLGNEEHRPAIPLGDGTWHLKVRLPVARIIICLESMRFYRCSLSVSTQVTSDPLFRC